MYQPKLASSKRPKAVAVASSLTANGMCGLRSGPSRAVATIYYNESDDVGVSNRNYVHRDRD